MRISCRVATSVLRKCTVRAVRVDPGADRQRHSTRVSLNQIDQRPDLIHANAEIEIPDGMGTGYPSSSTGIAVMRVYNTATMKP